MDVVAKIHGGGVSSQAGALRHGIARALWRPTRPCAASSSAAASSRATRASRSARRPASRRPASARSSRSASHRHGATRSFGTDGVRGVAGEFLTAELALALGRAAAAIAPRGGAAGAHRARHARVGRDARGVAGGRRGRRRRARAARRRAAHPGRGAARPPPRVRPGRGGVRLAQPLPGQRDQVLRSRWHEDLRRARGAHRGGARRRRRAARAPRSAACASSTAPRGDYLRELELRFRDLDLSGSAGAAGLRATAPPTAPAPEIFRRLGADVEAAGGRARRPQHQRRRGLHPRRRAGRRGSPRAASTWALPSTATATACWPSTAPAPWWTATS